jgi:hypothetical protein
MDYMGLMVYEMDLDNVVLATLELYSELQMEMMELKYLLPSLKIFTGSIFKTNMYMKTSLKITKRVRLLT